MSISERTLTERIHRFLTSFAVRGVEPGRWEAYCAQRALQALKDRDIAAGETFIDYAKMPPDRRSSSTLPDFSPHDPSPMLTQLVQELEQIRLANR